MSPILGLAALLAVLLVCPVFCQQEEPCNNTPFGGPGNCVDIHACPAILALLKQKPLPNSTIQQLQRAQCGYIGTTPKVCCPGNAPVATQRPPTNRPPTARPPRPPGPQTARPVNSNRPQTSRPPPSNPNVVSAQPAAVSLRHPKIGLLPMDSCGTSLYDRIVNGRRAVIGQFPWMARIGYQSRGGESFRCGGSVISKRYVLTAAHCITNLPPSLRLLSVVLGEHEANSDPDCEDVQGVYVCMPSVQRFTIERSVAHPRYTTGSVQNDIGLIRLDKDADLTVDSVRAVCLPVGNIQFKNLESAQGLTVSGWGTTENGSSSTSLLYVEIPTVPNEQCRRKYANQTQIIDSQLCAGGSKQDSCDGDSGGPLTIPDVVGDEPSPRVCQVGVVSFGPVRCGTLNSPGVYSRVGHFLGWILDNMEP